MSEKRMIDANALKKQAYPFPCAIGTELAVPIRAIYEAPSVPAEVVRHGRWKTLYLNSHICSECNMESEDRNRYCPHCGCCMDGQGEGDSNE